MMGETDNIAARKAALRATMLARRAGYDPAAGAALTWLASSPLILPGAVVGGFWPIGAEIDIRPLLAALHGLGHTVGLPRTPPPGGTLTFHAWTPGAEMRRERFGTSWPPDGPPVEPSVLLVPLLAFDRAGGRIGYGGGYYDRAIAARPGVTTIGCAYAMQETDEVPREAHDAMLDYVATETALIFGQWGRRGITR